VYRRPGGLWLANSPFCDVWDAYCTVLNERPLFTKIMTGMLGTFLGDLLAQCLANLPRASSPGPASAIAKEQGSKEQGSKEASPLAGRGFQYDAARTLRLLAYSALVGTPVAHWWFGLLDAVSTWGVGAGHGFGPMQQNRWPLEGQDA
jgi:hypothetical protein